MALLALGDLLCGFAQTSIQLFIFRAIAGRSEEHTSELQSQSNLVCRLLLEKKKHFQIHVTSLKIASRRPGGNLLPHIISLHPNLEVLGFSRGKTHASVSTRYQSLSNHQSF